MIEEAGGDIDQNQMDQDFAPIFSREKRDRGVSAERPFDPGDPGDDDPNGIWKKAQDEKNEKDIVERAKKEKERDEDEEKEDIFGDIYDETNKFSAEELVGDNSDEADSGPGFQAAAESTEDSIREEMYKISTLLESVGAQAQSEDDIRKAAEDRVSGDYDEGADSLISKPDPICPMCESNTVDDEGALCDACMEATEIYV